MPTTSANKLFHRLHTMSFSQQASLLLRLMRGLWYAPRFDRKRWILAGTGLRIEKRFGEIHLGDMVGVGSQVGLAVIGKNSLTKALLKIGDHTYIQDRTHINCYQSISIGSHCAISWDVEILDTDIHIMLDEKGRPLENVAPVMIEDRVWIGARAIILKGVTIGHDSVIAAGAVVARPVPPFSICAGNPAIVIKTGHGWQP